LIALVALFVFIYVPTKIEQQALEAIDKKVQTIAAMTAYSISPALFFNDVDGMEDVLSSAKQNEDIVYVVVSNDSGRILAAFNKNYAENQDFKNTHTLEKLSEQDMIYKTSNPIKKNNVKIGDLYFGISLKQLRAKVENSREAISVVSALFFFTGVLIIFGISTLFTRPLSQMVETAKNITKGDITLRAEIHARDEVGILAETFNKMLDHLETAQSSLLGANQNLEKHAKDLKQEITVRKHAELDLKNFAAKLKQSNRSLQDFAYVASHDLQEPLRKVQAFGDRLKLKCSDSLSEQGLDYLERMQNAASRMQTLINDLLTYSRVTTQAQPFVDVKLTEVTQDVLSDLEVRIEELGGQIQLDDLPTIKAEPVQIRQLMQNFIGNALKFHKPDECPIVKIHGELLNENKNQTDGNSVNEVCQITIVDNGIGFEEKYADRIFGVFQRLHGRDEYQGTGVGLAVCQKIVERHGGDIITKSNPGEGTTFIIRLPVNQSNGENLS